MTHRTEALGNHGGTQMEQCAIEGLQAISPEEAIIERIGRYFNPAPFLARTDCEQMRRYSERFLGLERIVGQVTFLAISADVPPGRPVILCQQVPVSLALGNPDDMQAMPHGWRRMAF